MASECKRCGVEYSGLILERFSKYDKFGLAAELFLYVVLGGYAAACYFFYDSLLMLGVSTIVAIVLYGLLAPKFHWYCDDCIELNKFD